MATLGNWGEEWALRLQGEMGCKRSRFARGERLKEVMVVGGKRGSRLQVQARSARVMAAALAVEPTGTRPTDTREM